MQSCSIFCKPWTRNFATPVEPGGRFTDPVRTLFLFCAATLGAQTSSVVDRALATANRTATYSGIAISPDGEHLAWVQGTVGTQPMLLHIALPVAAEKMSRSRPLAPPTPVRTRVQLVARFEWPAQ